MVVPYGLCDGGQVVGRLPQAEKQPEKTANAAFWQRREV